MERELGEGGAATVYLARDLRHERPVAIKVFRPELAETLGAERFTREIRTAANLQHPHILTVHDSGTADGLLYYVMPYVEGESLRARIEREGGLPIADVVRILREVADALSTAHAQGVVHRDIKPDNVLLSGRHALVADFGVAKAISEATGQQRVTTVGVALGTPAYMAPEQAAADPHLDHRVDIYALGVLGYEMLTGDPPFVRRTVQEVIAAHVTEPAPAVSVRRPSVPPALDSLIARCLAKQPADRWQSADDVVAELERLSTPTQGVAPTTAAAPASVVSRTRSRPDRVAMIAVAVLVVLALVWAAASRFGGSKAASAGVVAVLPFEFNATPDVAYLREGIVNVLETNLTGEGGPRAVPSQTAIAQWKRRGGDKRGLTEDEALAVASELGAGQLLRGSIVGTASNLILSGTLVSTTPGGRSIQANVNGPADSIAVMAARLAGQLLSLRVGEGAERAALLQSVPPSALFAYLEGQAHLRAGRYADAVKSLDRALTIDSTFALAGIAQAIATGWSPTSTGNTPGGEIALRHKDKLGPRDLVLLQMLFPTRFEELHSGREVLVYRERLVQQITDRAEGWYLIGDQYFHSGLAHGFSREESRTRAENAFRKALALDPGITYLRGHILDLAWDPLEPARSKHVADSLGPTTHFQALFVALTAGDSATVRRLRAGFDTLSTDELMLSAYFASMGGAPTLGRELLTKALERPGDESVRRNVLRGARGEYWSEGRPADAAKAHDRMLQLSSQFDRGSPADVVLAAVFADGDTLGAAVAARTYSRLMDSASAGAGVTTSTQRGRAWFSGLWASYRGDSATLGASIRRLDALGARTDSAAAAALARLYADGLRLAGSARTPSREIAERADAALREGPPITADTRAALNLIVARSFERLGDARRAATAAARTTGYEIDYVMSTAGLRDFGRLSLAAGDTTTALRAWRDYLMRRSPEPAQRRVDDDIRKKVDELQRVKR
ncbi:MAG: protein kinase [Gemmatimonadales bacterium]